MDTHRSPKTRIARVAKYLGRNAVTVVVVIIAFAIGFWLKGAPPDTATRAQHAGHGAKSDVIWTCAMHPQIRLPEPGACPICGMNLIPAEDGGEPAAAANSRRFVTSEATKALMNIQTQPVERRFATAEIRMVGKIDYDETKLGYITAWVPGRIDTLYVDFTGIEVSKGDHLVSLYSPDMLTAQDEMRRAAEAVAGLRPEAPQIVRETASATLEAAREKLRRWGLTDDQVRDAETKGALSDHVTIFAPMGGTVIDRNGQEGMYVETGTRIYTIADLSELWVKLDAYESDLAWLHYGQTVSFTTEAYPGEEFEGRIAFIEPTLDRMTRTVKVRVNVPNPDGKLKPEMFIRATVRAQVATHGRVMDPGLAGKWISPMHPEIVSDEPGTCKICGMELKRAEDLGYVAATTNRDDMPLVIPASAALLTGKRAVVYVQVPGADQPTYEGREVELGPRTGDYYIVNTGLSEGEYVVTNGNFKIDSALQISAKPSMMSPEGGGPAHQGHVH